MHLDIRVIHWGIRHHDSQGSHQASGSGASTSKGKDKGMTLARAYAVQSTSQHDTAVGTTVNGMVLVSSFWAHFLFDTGASHSFISKLFVIMLGLDLETLDSVMSVGVPLGKDYKLSSSCSYIRIKIGGR